MTRIEPRLAGRRVNRPSPGRVEPRPDVVVACCSRNGSVRGVETEVPKLHIIVEHEIPVGDVHGQVICRLVPTGDVIPEDVLDTGTTRLHQQPGQLTAEDFGFGGGAIAVTGARGELCQDIQGRCHAFDGTAARGRGHGRLPSQVERQRRVETGNSVISTQCDS